MGRDNGTGKDGHCASGGGRRLGDRFARIGPMAIPENSKFLLSLQFGGNSNAASPGQ